MKGNASHNDELKPLPMPAASGKSGQIQITRASLVTVKEYCLSAHIWLPRPRSEVFAFFGNPENLNVLTPPWLNFEIRTATPVEMGPRTVILYRSKVHGVPFNWRTEIVLWRPPYRFVDVQLEGPYTDWHHTHTFEERHGGTSCFDHVRYWPKGGSLMNGLLVQRDLEKIFAYRHAKLKELFPKHTSAPEFVPQPEHLQAQEHTVVLPKPASLPRVAPPEKPAPKPATLPSVAKVVTPVSEAPPATPAPPPQPPKPALTADPRFRTVRRPVRKDPKP